MVVLIAIRDLFFSSKVDAALTAAGGADVAAPARASRSTPLLEQVRALAPARLIVELAIPEAVETIRAIKSDKDLAATQVVGYCRHTEIERIRAAKAAGCDRVLTQGELAELLPALLDGSSELPKGAAHCDV